MSHLILKCSIKSVRISLLKLYVYHNLEDFTRMWEVSAENTKYAEHYTSYGYSFHIYGDFEEILK